MAVHSAPATKNKTTLAVGAGLILASLVVLVGLGVWLAQRNALLRAPASAEAMLYVDTPGRSVIDGTLQIDGPAPVPVSAGKHTIAFFDTGQQLPLTASVAAGAFTYIAHLSPQPYYTGQASQIAAFPPDTTISVTPCQRSSWNCQSTHILRTQLPPGTYTVSFSNPHLGSKQEQITVPTDASVRHTFSFITTVAEWDTWRQQHGASVERGYARSYRRAGADDILLLPFEVAGELAEELFD